MMHRFKHTRDLACLALLLVVVVAFFWPLVTGGAWIPHGGGDLASFLWPMYEFAGRSLRSGTVPLWNPHLHSGTPFLADNQSGPFYPPNLLAVAIAGPPSYAAMQGLVVLHIWLAAVAMFALLRGLELRHSAALVGALAFALSDLFVTHLGNLNLNATAAWLPLILWFTRQALTTRRARWAGAAGLTLGVAALAGHAQMLLFLALTIGLYVIYHLGTLLAAQRQRFAVPAAQAIGLASLIIVVGVGVAALTLLPAYELAGHTGRGHLPYEEATRYSLPPRALIGLIAPGFYGRGPVGFWGPWDRVEVGYAGVGTLALAAFGLIAHSLPLTRSSGATPESDDQATTFPIGFFALLIPVAFTLAMGRYTPLYRLLYRWIPTFDQIRAPARLIVIGNLGLAALAAYGLHRLSSTRSRRGRRMTGDLAAWWVGITAGVAALLLVGLALPFAHSLPPPNRVATATQSIFVAATLLALNGSLFVLFRRWVRALWLFPMLLAVDLIILGSTVEIERNDPTRGFDHPEVVSYLEQDPSLFRIENTAAAWQPDAALKHGLYDIGGVHNPLNLAPYEAYRWALGQRGDPRHNLLGVKYVIADKNDPPEGRGLVPVYAADPTIDIYLNPAALPRALFVSSCHVVADHEEAWQAIHHPEFEPVRTVILERDQLPADPWPEQPGVPREAPARITFEQYDPDQIELTIDTPSDGWLVLSDVYYPGWKATVNDQMTPVLRANYTFRALQVPAGRHTVVLTFAPWTWHLGLALSLTTWLALAGAAVITLRSDTRAPTPDSCPPRRSSWLLCLTLRQLVKSEDTSAASSTASLSDSSLAMRSDMIHSIPRDDNPAPEPAELFRG